MLPGRRGSIHLFRLFQIDVFLHWSWFLAAVALISYSAGNYSSITWSVAEYLCLFLIVTMHEFGHSLACRGVGGKADQIILWPLGGVAFVDPPPRPGAMLWSIAAGPLVNLVLLPLLSVICLLAMSGHLAATSPNLYEFLISIWFINATLLGFNLLPIYPLDGGQILRSLLWFAVGRARSLMIASTVGFVTVGLLFIFAIRQPWLAIMGVFVLMNCWTGLKQARILARMEAAPKRPEFACPKCHAPVPLGLYWICARCRQPFDLFADHGLCPHCAAQYPVHRCFECGEFFAVR